MAMNMRLCGGVLKGNCHYRYRYEVASNVMSSLQANDVNDKESVNVW